MGTDTESFIVRLLWQYHDVAKASERAHTKAYSGMQCKETPEGFLNPLKSLNPFLLWVKT
jgi:hypothetical protein